MSATGKSLVISSPKPINVFYVWYGELCRRVNASPLSIVKPAKPKNETVLDFVADRIKAEEWSPIVNALRQDTSLHVIAIRSRLVNCQFLQDVDTEDKARHMKRRYASLWTDYIFNSLLQSLCCCLQKNQLLSSLELEGLPLFDGYMNLLIKGLKTNKTIKILSLKHSPIKDVGCQQLCRHLCTLPNVEILNLSTCNLGSISAQHIAKLIRFQQIHRYCESWHNSLRYENPEVGFMRGLKRVTLNNNPNIGDEGLSYILDELDDDLWIKAVDMQRCNITESMSNRIIDIVNYSRSLEIADFRNNAHLSMATVEKVLEILNSKQKYGLDSEYQWCLSTSTLACDSSYRESTTPSVISNTIQKSKSAPIRQFSCKFPERLSSAPTLHRAKTICFIQDKSRGNTLQKQDKKQINQATKEVATLNARLEMEMSKNKEIEMLNKTLLTRINDMNKLNNLDTLQDISTKGKLSEFIQVIQDLGLSDNDLILPKIKDILNQKKLEETSVKCNKTSDKFKCKTKKKVRNNKAKAKLQKQDDIKSGLAQTILEQLLFNDNNDQEVSDEEDILQYFSNEINNNVVTNTKENDSSDTESVASSASNVSLLKLVAELKNSDDDQINQDIVSPTSTDSSSSSQTLVQSEPPSNQSSSRKFQNQVPHVLLHCC